VDKDDMIVTLDRLSKVANLCVKELEANDISRVFKAEVEEFRDVITVIDSLTD